MPIRLRRVPVTEIALLKRINRRLAKDLESLRKNRGGPYTETLPDWLHIDENRNAIIGGTNDLEAFGRELGVLKPWEQLAEQRAEPKR
jgi:hypothetical protein